jgi:methylmalonyl-CoA/ethylmalonyl-CoA epimerase
MLTYDELIEYNSKRRICQIGILSDNIEETLKNMVEKFNIGPWVICDIDDTTSAEKIQIPEYSEEKFKMRIGICNLGNTQLEVIQPFYGLPVYQKQLDAGTACIHHLKECFNDITFPQNIKKYADKGMRNVFSANLYNSKFAYLESLNEIGFYFELGNGREADLPEDFRVWYYPEQEL